MNYEKPHLHWKEIFAMSNDLTKPEAGVPDWARHASTGAAFGNIDASDLRPPRLKVLAGQSPEVMDGTPDAVPGNFWLTILNQNLGKEVTGSPILLRKSYQLWAPKVPGSEQKGPLATASDGINWDQPNQTFEVKFPGNPRVYKWVTKKTVFENNMHRFGSSQSDDPKSKPAATLTYDILWLIDLPGSAKQLCVFTNARTGIKPTQNFISTVRAMGIDQFYQRYRIVIQRKTGSSGDTFFSYDYQYISPVSEEQGAANRTLWESYRRTGFVAEREEEVEHAAPQPQRDVHEIDPDEIPF